MFKTHKVWSIRSAFKRIIIWIYVTEEPNLLTKQRGAQALTSVLLFWGRFQKGRCPSALEGSIQHLNPKAHRHQFAHSPIIATRLKHFHIHAIMPTNNLTKETYKTNLYLANYHEQP